ncbi:MAG: thermonuclease family protein [Candidatus Limnocylindrales bacterium]
MAQRWGTDTVRAADYAAWLGFHPARAADPPPGPLARYVTLAVAAVLVLSAIAVLVTPPDSITRTVPAQPTAGTPGTAGPPGTPSPSAVGAKPTSSSTATFAPTGPTQPATVVRVTDGDTIVVAINGVRARVRSIGIDTLEPDDPDPVGRALADAATAANRGLVEGRNVLLERDVSETDRFDRLLRNVWVEQGDGTLVLVGLELVRQGLARLDTFPLDVKYVDLIRERQRAARDAGVGMWASGEPEPVVSPTPLRLVDPALPRRAGCDDSYPDVCIPPYPPDLDCGQITARAFTVRAPDPHGFDREGDGLGCED